MKFRGTKISKRTVALFAAAIMLLCGGGAVGTAALPNIVGQDYVADIELDELGVSLYENDVDVSGGALLENTFGEAKVIPGKSYKEEIAVQKADGSADEYVRVVVRKYWTKDGEAVKKTELSPDLIQLSYNGKDYNSSKWIKGKTSTETEYYYYKTPLTAKEAASAPLFNKIRIDDSILDAVSEDVTEPSEATGGKTVYTYTYDYNGYQFNVEAEAQAVQTHNAKDAIKSVWGVSASAIGLSVEE